MKNLCIALSAGMWKPAGTAWLHPHATISFLAPAGSKYHVNAEVRPKGHCGGAKLYDTYDEKDGLGSASEMTFELDSGDGREWLWFKHAGRP